MFKKKMVALFPGQGSQYFEMLNKFKENQYINDIFEQANNILNIDIKKMCVEEDISIFNTEFAQPIIFTLSYAMYKFYIESNGDLPYIALGHSLGELSALACAEVLKFEDLLKLVAIRGRLMSTISEDYAMTAVLNVKIEELENKINKTNEQIYISNYNSQNQIVISAKTDIMDDFENKIKNIGGNVKRLKVSKPFHTILMKDIAIQFSEYVNQYEFLEPKFKVLSNVTGNVHTKDLIAKRIVEQIYKPVKFIDCMKTIKRIGIDKSIEFGAGNVLTKLAIKNYNDISAYSMDDYLEQDKLKELLEINLEEEKSILEKVNLSLGEIVSTKFNNYTNEVHKSMYEKYKVIEQIRNNIEMGSNQLTNAEISKECIKLLKDILDIKNVDEIERNEIVQSIWG